MTRSRASRSFEAGKTSEGRGLDYMELGSVLDQCWEKIQLRNTTNSERIRWLGIVIEAVKQRETLRKNSKDEELEKRLEILEEALKRRGG